MKLDVAAVRDLNSIKTFKCLYLDQKTKGQQIIIKKKPSTAQQQPQLWHCGNKTVKKQ